MHHASRAVATVVFASITLVASASSAVASADYSSFFWQRELAGAGWTSCEQPITWSLDARGLTSRQVKREIARLEQAWGAWSVAAGIPVRFTGTESLAFDPGTNGLRRTDGSPQPDRHVYLAMKTGQQVPIMTRGVIGLGMPSIVLLPDREIVAGMAIFRRGYVLEHRKEDPDRVLHVYLHELGHILGLGHAGNQVNVMYPSLDHRTSLGRGDIAGVRAITQPCTRDVDGVPVTIKDWSE